MEDHAMKRNGQLVEVVIREREARAKNLNVILWFPDLER